MRWGVYSLPQCTTECRTENIKETDYLKRTLWNSLYTFAYNKHITLHFNVYLCNLPMMGSQGRQIPTNLLNRGLLIWMLIWRGMNCIFYCLIRVDVSLSWILPVSCSCRCDRNALLWVPSRTPTHTTSHCVTCSLHRPMRIARAEYWRVVRILFSGFCWMDLQLQVRNGFDTHYWKLIFPVVRNKDAVRCFVLMSKPLVCKRDLVLFSFFKKICIHTRGKSKSKTMSDVLVLCVRACVLCTVLEVVIPVTVCS